MELAIDTSTASAGIAISDRGNLIAELSWHSEQNHTVELVPNIDRLLKEYKLEIKMIKAIFIATGPGSFNGLRVGVSAAKGFALALNSPIVGISTFEVEAYPFANTKLPICPIHNAGRSEIATALYIETNQWQCLRKEYITTFDELCRSIESRTIFCGEIPQEIIEELQKRMIDLAIIPDILTRTRKPRYLAELGWLRFSRLEINDPALLQPIYLRQPPITQSKTRIVRK